MFQRKDREQEQVIREKSVGKDYGEISNGT